MTTEFDAAEKERALQAESATWDTSAPQPAADGDIPVIDVEEWFRSGSAEALAAVGAELRDASERVGFHQLVGHGFPDELSAGALAEARRFHALPVETKRRILMDRADWPLGGVGYLPERERKLPRRAKGNVNAAFLCKSDRHIGPEENQWLDEDALPGFRATVLRYQEAITALAVRLLPMYAVALDLDPVFFADAFTHPFSRLRLTHYPAAEVDAAADEFGIAPHVDTTFFTLLLTDGPGLVIFSHERDAWITAPVVEGAFIVNSGELLRQWSNDRVLSTRHFAVNPPTGDRYSVPFFFNANADHKMVCLPSCHGPDNPPKYPPFSYNESQATVQGE